MGFLAATFDSGGADRIGSIHNMGALSLNTSSLKSQLKRECSAWKTKYCQNLHRQAKDSLESLTEYMRVRTRVTSQRKAYEKALAYKYDPQKPFWKETTLTTGCSSISTL